MTTESRHTEMLKALRAYRAEHGDEAEQKILRRVANADDHTEVAPENCANDALRNTSLSRKD